MTLLNQVPNSWWMSGFGLSGALCVGLLSVVFDLPVYQGIAALLLAALVSVLAVRALGETDLNPTVSPVHSHGLCSV